MITNIKAKNIKPDDKPIAHGGVVGLVLRPSKIKGHGFWVLRFVSPVTGKRRNIGLGTYPEISIAEVAKTASEMREKLAHGKDPLEEKKIEIAKLEAMRSMPSFEEAARILHADLLPSWKNIKHGQQWINTLQQYIFPHIGTMMLNTIEPTHIAHALKPIWLSKSETASRVKQRIHAVMAWGWAHGYCYKNPVDVVKKLLPPIISKAARVQHQPAMPWRDIPEFLNKHVINCGQYDISRSILLFLILTACRSGEARGMRWSEVDFNNQIWTIPATRMKVKQQHRVPLSRQAIGVLKNLRGLHPELVFPSPRKQGELSDMVMTEFLKGHHAQSDTEGRYATAHGFRSSFRDWCSENEYPRDWAERALAHTVANQVEAAYHRTDLLDKRAGMMQAWADFIYGE